jgi:predicted TPR repeat methyltransferase/Flp pilus assembly protein TadD
MDSQQFSLYLQSVYTHLAQHELMEAQVILDQMIASFPDEITWEVYHLRGVSKWLTDDLYGAERDFLRSLECSESQKFVHNNLGNVLYAQGRLQEAIQAYKKALVLDDHYAQAHSHLGLCYALLDERDLAEKHHQQAIRIETNNAEFYYNFALFHQRNSDYLQMEVFLRRALTISPDDPEIYQQLGTCMLEQKRNIEARSFFSQGLGKAPNRLDIMVNLALCAIQDDVVEEAKARLETVLEQDPHHAGALVEYAKIMRNENLFPLAQKCLEQAAESASENAEVWKELGNIYSDQNQNKASLVAYKKSLHLHYDQPDVHLYVGHLLGEQKEFQDEAKKSYREAQRLDPECEQSAFMLAMMEGDDSIKRAPQGYVRDLFDAYAPTFDLHLKNVLRYQTPRYFCEMLSELHPVQKHFCRILDLGCGTGMMMEEYKEQGFGADDIRGVDLSVKMVEMAKQKDLYNQLEVKDMIAFLEVHDSLDAQKYNLICAADVFGYLGDLLLVFRHIKNILHPEGYFLFSIEEWKQEEWKQEKEGSLSEKKYHLHSDGRFSHEIQTIERWLHHCGLAVVQKQKRTLRLQHEQPIAGWVICAVSNQESQ